MLAAGLNRFVGFGRLIILLARVGAFWLCRRLLFGLVLLLSPISTRVTFLSGFVWGTLRGSLVRLWSWIRTRHVDRGILYVVAAFFGHFGVWNGRGRGGLGHFCECLQPGVSQKSFMKNETEHLLLLRFKVMHVFRYCFFAELSWPDEFERCQAKALTQNVSYRIVYHNRSQTRLAENTVWAKLAENKSLKKVTRVLISRPRCITQGWLYCTFQHKYWSNGSSPSSIFVFGP